MRLSLATDFLSSLLVVAAVALLTVGIASNSWPRAPATVTAHGLESITLKSYGTQHAHRNTPLDVETAEYQYAVGGGNFSGRRVCFCLPLGAPTSHFERHNPTVAYYPRDPSLAVLFPGADMPSVIVLFLLAAAVFASGRFLPSYFRRQSSESSA